jgi:hypothetical protein
MARRQTADANLEALLAPSRFTHDDVQPVGKSLTDGNRHAVTPP